MANPEHEEKLDFLDKVSVSLYRTGISVFSLFLFVYSIVLIGQSGMFNVSATMNHILFVGLACGAMLSAANVHVYNKVVRYVISWSTWLGIFMMLADSTHTIVWLSLGLLFITFSGIALKESFCFKVIGLKLVPILLAVSVFLIFFKLWLISGVLLLVASSVLLYLSKEKWHMPLHFDIGDKSRYQV